MPLSFKWSGLRPSWLASYLLIGLIQSAAPADWSKSKWWCIWILKCCVDETSWQSWLFPPPETDKWDQWKAWLVESFVLNRIQAFRFCSPANESNWWADDVRPFVRSSVQKVLYWSDFGSSRVCHDLWPEGRPTSVLCPPPSDFITPARYRHNSTIACWTKCIYFCCTFSFCKFE